MNFCRSFGHFFNNIKEQTKIIHYTKQYLRYLYIIIGNCIQLVTIGYYRFIRCRLKRKKKRRFMRIILSFMFLVYFMLPTKLRVVTKQSIIDHVAINSQPIFHFPTSFVIINVLSVCNYYPLPFFCDLCFYNDVTLNFIFYKFFVFCPFSSAIGAKIHIVLFFILN